jgi:hypothetical protein
LGLISPPSLLNSADKTLSRTTGTSPLA